MMLININFDESSLVELNYVLELNFWEFIKPNILYLKSIVLFTNCLYRTISVNTLIVKL